MANAGKNGRRTLRAGIAMIPALLIVAGCTPENAAIMAGASIISVIETDKTIPDHVMSQVMNKDCSALRLVNDKKMCLDENSTTTVAESDQTYCYHTLGEISCYATPNPYDPHTNQVAWPRPAEPDSSSSLALRDGENKGH